MNKFGLNQEAIKKVIWLILVVFVLMLIFGKKEQKTVLELETQANGEWLINKDYESALKLYEQAIEIMKEDKQYGARIYKEIAYKYFLLKDYNNAKSYYIRAINLNNDYKNDFDVNLYLGECYSELNDSISTIKYFNEAIKINPNDASPYINLVVFYRKLGNNELADKYHKLFNKYDPNTTTDYNLSSSSSVSKTSFESWLLRNSSVTEVHFESDWQIWVTLSPDKYTSKANVEQIANTIARWFAQRIGKSRTVCTVWDLNVQSVYAKGYYP